MRDSGAASQCCTAQPPHTPKCGQIGAMRSALGRCDVNQTPPVGVAGPPVDLDRLAGQRAGNVDRAAGAVGDAVAAMAEPIDHQPLNHARPR